MKKQIKNFLIIILTIQIVLLSTIFSGSVFGATVTWTDPSNGITYNYQDGKNLYISCTIDKKDATIQFEKDGDGFNLVESSSGKYLALVGGVPKEVKSDKIVNALGVSSISDIKTAWSSSDISETFITDDETEEEPEEEDPSLYRSSDYAKYSFSGTTLQVTYIETLEKNTLKASTYSYDYSTKIFTINSLNSIQCDYYSDFNSTAIQYTVALADISSVGIQDSDVPEEIINGEPEPEDGGIDPVPTEDDSDADIFDKAIDGVAGLILYPMKMVPLIIGKVLSWVMNMFAGSGATGVLTVTDILFNNIPLTDINFFDFNTSDATVKQIRVNVATWYYGIRNLAAVILICILIYVGIRMAMATVAEDRAKYKQMLIDWFVGLALLFVLHFIMIFIININNGLVNILSKPLTTSSGKIKDEIMDQLFANGWSIGFTKGVGSAICYMLLVGMTFIFLISYIKRMITIAFLIVIAPLVTVTYSIDKMGDGKSQALNTWLKEFTYNILIQPFQCVTYLALGSAAVGILNNGYSLKSVVVAIMIFIFILQAEKIIKTIFHFEAKSMSDTLGSAVFAGAVLSKMKDGGSKKKGGSGGGSSKYADPTSMMTPNTNATNVQPGGDPSRPPVGGASGGTPAPAGQASGGSTSNVPSQSGSQTKKPRSTRVSGAQRVIGTYLGTSFKAGLALSGGAFYMGATGDAKGVVPVTTGMWGLGDKGATGLTKRDRRRRLARAYNNYADHLAKQDPTLTTDEINARTRQRAVNLMYNNVSGPLDEYDKQLQESMREINETYKNSGMSEEERNEQLNEDFGDIETGKVSEVIAPVRLYGKIKDKVNNRSWGFAGGTPNPTGGANPGGAPNPNGGGTPGGTPTPNPNPGGTQNPTGGANPGGTPNPNGGNNPGGNPNPNPQPGNPGGRRRRRRNRNNNNQA